MWCEIFVMQFLLFILSMEFRFLSIMTKHYSVQKAEQIYSIVEVQLVMIHISVTQSFMLDEYTSLKLWVTEICVGCKLYLYYIPLCLPWFGIMFCVGMPLVNRLLFCSTLHVFQNAKLIDINALMGMTSCYG